MRRHSKSQRGFSHGSLLPSSPTRLKSDITSTSPTNPLRSQSLTYGLRATFGREYSGLTAYLDIFRTSTDYSQGGSQRLRALRACKERVCQLGIPIKPGDMEIEYSDTPFLDFGGTEPWHSAFYPNSESGQRSVLRGSLPDLGGIIRRRSF